MCQCRISFDYKNRTSSRQIKYKNNQQQQKVKEKKPTSEKNLRERKNENFILKKN